MSRLLRVRRLGVVSYAGGLAAQQAALSAHQAALAAAGAGARHQAAPAAVEAPHQLLLLQHSPVYTVGRREFCDEKEQERLRQTGAEFHRTDRGGLITFHGPGQLVAYPMLNLAQLGVRGPRRYVNLLEEAVIEVCRRMGVASETSPHTGVWCGDNKICAIGIHLTRRVLTSHGLALNCSVDLDWFRHIVPCGIRDKFVTSLEQQLNRPVPVQEASLHLVDVLASMLNCRVVADDDSDGMATAISGHGIG